jgi:hypothetical protein
MTEDRHQLAVERSWSGGNKRLGPPGNSCADIPSEGDRSDLGALVESPHDVFETLDGTEMFAEGREWRIEVFSVVADQISTWVQLRLGGDPEHMLTVKVPRQQSAAQTIDVLAAWLRNPTRSPQILSTG